MTYPEAAEYLSISLRQFRRLLDSGKLPYVKVGERSRRVRLRDLKNYLDSVTIKHVAA